MKKLLRWAALSAGLLVMALVFGSGISPVNAKTYSLSSNNTTKTTVKQNNRTVYVDASSAALKNVSKKKAVKVSFVVSSAKSGKVLKKSSKTVRVNDGVSSKVSFYDGAKSAKYRVTVLVSEKNRSQAVRGSVNMTDRNVSMINFSAGGKSKVTYWGHL